MKTLTLAALFCVIAIPAFAAFGQHHHAPAPLIGLGVEGALAIGGALLGCKLVRRWRGSK